jgi:fructose-1,6-bisphosphatase/inositol monophosphatase family enzyme
MSGHLEFAASVAREAGKIIKQNFTLGMKRELKTDLTPITDSDLAVNQLVIDRVKKTFPGHGVLGEESSFHSNREYVWVCDPIDGTLPFSHGIPICVFSLALTKNGKPILGTVFDPFLFRLFTAELGKGAFLNNHKVQVSKTKLSESVINLNGAKELGLGKLWDILNQNNAKVISLWSVIYAGVLVAAGEFSGTIFGHSAPWDGAALKVIVEEAGGKVTDLAGNEQLYNQPTKGFIASNGIIHQELVNQVAKILKERQ